MKYSVMIELGEDDFWITHVPSLPGCHSQGKTREDAMINIKEAIELFIETYILFGDQKITSSILRMILQLYFG